MKKRRGFTLVELLVVIGIIGVLVAILIPVIGKVRISAQTADTKAFVSQLTAAIERYHGDFHAYPGPLPNDLIRSTACTLTTATSMAAANSTVAGTLRPALITGNENLVLGLLGGLTVEGGVLVYDAAQVGRGAVNLSAVNPKRYTPYAELNTVSFRKVSDQDVSRGLATGADRTAGKSIGLFEDGAAYADDTIIPEFQDRFSSPLPLLYLRARPGAVSIAATSTVTDNGVINGPGANTPASAGYNERLKQQYDLDSIIGYLGTTATSIGEGKSPKRDYSGGTAKPVPLYHGLRSVDLSRSMNQAPPSGLTYQYPFDAYPYFKDPSFPKQARAKDTYILISAGPDRIYGTEDDIASFGDITGQ